LSRRVASDHAVVRGRNPAEAEEVIQPLQPLDGVHLWAKRRGRTIAGAPVHLWCYFLDRPQCNKPLSQTGSFTSAIALLAHSSLSDDEPVSTGGLFCSVISPWLPLALLPFLPASRFPDDIITIKRKAESIVLISNYEQRPSMMRTASFLNQRQPRSFPSTTPVIHL
ncbi:hypothetical protein T12_15965, partial [Trichinella patagoniensis]